MSHRWTDFQTLKDKAIQLLRSRSGALVTQLRDDALLVIGHDVFFFFKRMVIGMFDKKLLIAILLFGKEPLVSVRIIIGGKCREKS